MMKTPLPLSKDPRKAKHGMSDYHCLVCGATLFINDSNPCWHCQYAWKDDFNCCVCPLKKENR